MRERPVLPNPYVLYCTIPIEEYDELITEQIKFIKYAMQHKRISCRNVIYSDAKYKYFSEEAKDKFSEELRKKGYRLNKMSVEWDKLWDD